MNEALRAMVEACGFEETVAVDPRQIHITQDVRDACAKNDCGHYGQNYMCPPAVGDLDHYREVVNSYTNGLLFSQVYRFKNRQDYRRMNEIMTGFEKTVEKLHRAIRKSDMEGTVFSAGCCTICKECGILTDDPCRFPDEAMPSLEASGIDVVQLTKDTGLVYNNGPKTMTIIGLILYNE